MTSMTRRRRAATVLLAGIALATSACADATTPATTPVAEVTDTSTDATTAVDDAFAELLGTVEVETIPVFLARDPFRPVVAAAVGEGGAAPAPDGEGAEPGAPEGAPQADGCVATAAGEVCDGELVELLGITVVAGREQADVRVAGNVHTVGEGDRFATSYLVESIDPPCASFLHGDELFTLCEGQQVLK